MRSWCSISELYIGCEPYRPDRLAFVATGPFNQMPCSTLRQMGWDLLEVDRLHLSIDDATFLEGTEGCALDDP